VMRADPATGRIANATPCGSAVMWAPWFLAAHAGVKVARLAGATVAADGYAKPYVIAVCFGSFFYALAGLFLLYGSLRRWFARAASLTAVMGVWLASPLVFYMYAHPSMSHANSFFCASALLYVCARWGRSSSFSAWAGMGALAGLGMLVRYDGVLWALAPAATWAALLYEKRSSALRLLALGVVCAACAVIVFSPQMMAWKYMHGSFFSGPKDFKLARDLGVWTSPHFRDVLFSGRRGVFFWMPIAWLGAAGWAMRSPVPVPLRAVAPVIFLLNAWMVGGWVMWWAGASFGPRFFVSHLPLFAFGIAAVMSRFSARGQKVAIGVVVLLIVWNFGLMAQYALRMIDREGDLSRREVIMNQWRVPGEVLGRAGDILGRASGNDSGLH